MCQTSQRSCRESSPTHEGPTPPCTPRDLGPSDRWAAATALFLPLLSLLPCSPCSPSLSLSPSSFLAFPSSPSFIAFVSYFRLCRMSTFSLPSLSSLSPFPLSLPSLPSPSLSSFPAVFWFQYSGGEQCILQSKHQGWTTGPQCSI